MNSTPKILALTGVIVVALGVVVYVMMAGRSTSGTIETQTKQMRPSSRSHAPRS